MEALSSSFLQKYALNHTVSSPSPLLQLHLKISSVKIDEKQPGFSHQAPIIPHSSAQSRRQRKLKTPDDDPSEPSEQSTDQIKAIKSTKNDSVSAKFFNALDNFICDYLDPPLRPSIDPKHVLSGNFAPVGELPPTPCRVINGSLPPSLDGAYIRNGPNPQFIPYGPYHLFDGDGMLHSVAISRGRATFCSRFVETYKFKLERDIGSPVVINVFSAFNGLLASLARLSVTFGRFLAGQYDPSRGVGNANTSLALIGGKLFALAESDLPYRVKLTSEGDLITVNRHESFGEAFMTMTAHPKIDGDTGEAFAFRHSIWRPFLSYFRINSDGIKQPEVPIYSLNQASFVHDFALTKNYAVFPETQMAIKPRDILGGRPPLRIDPDKVPRLGIIDRYAKDDSGMWWVEVPGFNMIHAANAWEDDGGDTVVVVASNVQPVEHMLERMDLIQASLERIEIDVRSKSVRRRSVSGRSLEFAVINPAYVGKKNRYIYAAVSAPMPKIGGVVKIDLSLSTTDSVDCTVATHLFPPGCYGGEPFFVAKDPDDPAAEEDGGYLVTFVHDENREESKFIVMDAKSPTLEIVAAVELPQRVPCGFHGIFVPQSELKNL